MLNLMSIQTCYHAFYFDFSRYDSTVNLLHSVLFVHALLTFSYVQAAVGAGDIPTAADEA